MYDKQCNDVKAKAWKSFTVCSYEEFLAQLDSVVVNDWKLEYVHLLTSSACNLYLDL